MFFVCVKGNVRRQINEIKRKNICLPQFIPLSPRALMGHFYKLSVLGIGIILPRGISWPREIHFIAR